MKQTARIISVYTADVMGVCSALFELGGMCVMHDASGCNSTYNTHDEPRWYDTDSLVFISGLSEMEAIMGSDDKLIGDICRAADELRPAFIAVAGTPVPMMNGTDFSAIASVIEKKTGIISFGFDTNGMHSYVSGAGMAFEALARRITEPCDKKDPDGVNILGVTPLDFSVCGSDKAMRDFLAREGFDVISCWAMGSALGDIRAASRASVNLVVSSCGLPAAKALRERFGTPYVIGTPYGAEFAMKISAALRSAASGGKNISAFGENTENASDAGVFTAVIGESVTAQSYAQARRLELGERVRVICAAGAAQCAPGACAFAAEDEDEIVPLLSGAARLIADPLYRPLCPPGCEFIPLPHEAFSGRMFRENIPDLINKSVLLREEKH
jgi:nitrogenase molybdenum-cofactor synthesis protein NifE